METKIKTANKIERVSNELKAQGKIIVTTNGCFDILHVGHLNLFEKAKEFGDVLIILLNSDNSVRRFKEEGRPIIPQEQRARLLSALSCVDYVVIFDEDEPLKLMEIVKPHKHIKVDKKEGFVAEKFKREKKVMESIGGERIQLQIEEPISTTRILERAAKSYKKESINC